MKATKIFLGLGTNIGDRENFLRRAILEIKRIATVKQKSSIYETSPVGHRKQNDFLNMVIEIETDIPPEKLLKETQEIEKKLGRIKNIKNGPREIDIDILIYGDRIVDGSDLKIPHPQMYQRKFVLIPLLELLNKKDKISKWTQKKSKKR